MVEIIGEATEPYEIPELRVKYGAVGPLETNYQPSAYGRQSLQPYSSNTPKISYSQAAKYNPN